MSYYHFGEIFKSLRKTSGLTQSELGKHIGGLSKTNISNYENGINYPDYETLIHIAKYFRVSTDYLLGMESGKTVDISGLTENQTEIIIKIVAEFVKSNEKSHQ